MKLAQRSSVSRNNISKNSNNNIGNNLIKSSQSKICLSSLLWIHVLILFCFPKCSSALDEASPLKTDNSSKLAQQFEATDLGHQSGPISSIDATSLEATDFFQNDQPPQQPTISTRDRVFGQERLHQTINSGAKLQRLKQSDVAPPVGGHNYAKVTETSSLNETPLTDCFAKRDEVLRRVGLQTRRQNNENHNDNGNQPRYQRVPPKIESFVQVNTANTTATSSYDDEFVPECNSDGRYEPIQCHKLIDYCWCVNKYGQAIRNSSRKGSKPGCTELMYESSTDSPIVTTSVSSQSQFLRHPDDVATDLPVDMDDLEAQSKANEDPADIEFNRRVKNSPEPSLSLIPNECGPSRAKAMERAAKHSDENIWIPECDSQNQDLYSTKQCHRSRICWCVDQATGLPLRTSEQLSKQSAINCTDIKRIIDMSAPADKAPKNQPSFINGFSEYCDAEQRYEFLLLLNDQFRQQVMEQFKTRPASIFAWLGTIVDPSEVPSNFNDSQLAHWRFSITDLDQDGKLNDREWSKFKANFRLVDRREDMQQRYRLQPSTSLSTLNILRSQRRCWRDFLEFCANGDLLNNDSISLTKWLSCVGLPASVYAPKGPPGGQQVHDIYAYSRAAALARAKNKNPFLGILKSD